MIWEHDALASDLASHLRGHTDRLVWEDMQLGPAGSPRPDVYTIQRSFTRWTPMAYEVKVTRPDFRSDITTGKWQDYRRYAAGVVFACPVNLIAKHELPADAGLMVRGDVGWRPLKKPTLQTLDNLPLETWVKLLLDGIERHARINLLPEREELIKNFLGVAAVKKKFGEQLGQLLNDREQAAWYLANENRLMREDADKLAKHRRQPPERPETANTELAAIRSELCAMLGVPDHCDTWVIRRAAQRQMDALRRDVEITRLQGLLGTVRQALDQARTATPTIAQQLKLPMDQ